MFVIKYYIFGENRFYIHDTHVIYRFLPKHYYAIFHRA